MLSQITKKGPEMLRSMLQGLWFRAVVGFAMLREWIGERVCNVAGHRMEPTGRNAERDGFRPAPIYSCKRCGRLAVRNGRLGLWT